MDGIRRRKIRNLLTAVGLALLILAAKLAVRWSPPIEDGPRFDVPLEAGG